MVERSEWEDGYKMGFKSGLIVGRRTRVPRWRWLATLLVVLGLMLALPASAGASPVGCTWEGKYGLVCCHAGTTYCR